MDKMRLLTIEAQLAIEFADRLDHEADAWLAVATEKRAKAVEYRMKHDALNTEAALLREAGAKLLAKAKSKEGQADA